MTERIPSQGKQKKMYVGIIIGYLMMLVLSSLIAFFVSKLDFLKIVSFSIGFLSFSYIGVKLIAQTHSEKYIGVLLSSVSVGILVGLLAKFSEITAISLLMVCFILSIIELFFFQKGFKKALIILILNCGAIYLLNEQFYNATSELVWTILIATTLLTLLKIKSFRQIGNMWGINLSDEEAASKKFWPGKESIAGSIDELMTSAETLEFEWNIWEVVFGSFK